MNRTTMGSTYPAVAGILVTFSLTAHSVSGQDATHPSLVTERDTIECLALRGSQIAIFQSDTAGNGQVLIDGQDRVGQTESWLRSTLGKADAEFFPGRLWYTLRCGDQTWILGVHILNGRVNEIIAHPK